MVLRGASPRGCRPHGLGSRDGGWTAGKQGTTGNKLNREPQAARGVKQTGRWARSLRPSAQPPQAPDKRLPGKTSGRGLRIADLRCSTGVWRRNAQDDGSPRSPAGQADLCAGQSLGCHSCNAAGGGPPVNPPAMAGSGNGPEGGEGRGKRKGAEGPSAARAQRRNSDSECPLTIRTAGNGHRRRRP